MKIYIASRYENKDAIRELAKVLKVEKFEVVSTWHKEKYDPNIQLENLTPARMRTLSLRDLTEIESCNALLIYTYGCEQSRGGMHFENGYADANEKKIYIIGPRITIFHFLPGVEQFDTLEDFLAEVPND